MENAECFTILGSAVSKFQIKIKEAMHIKWENPILNQQLKHLSPFNYFVLFFVCVSFISSFIILVIGSILCVCVCS